MANHIIASRDEATLDSGESRDDLLRNATAICRGERLPTDRDEASRLHHRGMLALLNEEVDVAIACLSRATTLRPAQARWRADLAAARARTGRLAIDRKIPQVAALVGAGRRLVRLGRVQDAIGTFLRAVEIDPHDIEACRWLVCACEVIEDSDDAASAWFRLGVALERRQRLHEARVAYAEAVRRRPDDVNAAFALGAVCLRSGRPAEAVQPLTRVLQLTPRHAAAHLELGWALAAEGRLERAWPGFAFYDRYGDRRRRFLEQPMWDGSPLEGKTVLLWADQALGDTIQYVRYAQAVAERGGRAIVECHRRLVPLLRGCPGVAAVIARGSPLPYADAHAPLTHLPRILGTTLSSVPARVPYLCVDPERRDAWRRRLASSDDLAVGLVWGGYSTRKDARERFTALSTFAPLAGMRGVRFISLQQGLPAIELLAPPLGLDVDVFKEETASTAETAALVCTLDLVITVDTMMAHLAGALARPVWTLLPHAADWRWQATGVATPWYPTMRLFRQARASDWRDVLQRVRHRLDVLLADRRAHVGQGHACTP